MKPESTLEALATLEKKFGDIDTNHNGLVSLSEMEEFARKNKTDRSVQNSDTLVDVLLGPTFYSHDCVIGSRKGLSLRDIHMIEQSYRPGGIDAVAAQSARRNIMLGIGIGAGGILGGAGAGALALELTSLAAWVGVTGGVALVGGAIAGFATYSYQKDIVTRELYNLHRDLSLVCGDR